MARPANQLVAKAGNGGGLSRPLLLALLAVPVLLVAITVLVACMVLFVRKVEATASCGGGSAVDPAALTELATGSDEPGPGTPPKNFIPAYFAAANQPDAQLGALGPFVLMAIHEVESGFGRSNAEGVKSGANFLGCCKGPFQFYDTPKWSTWLAHSPISGKTYARDGDGDRDADIYSNHDSMFAAAALLRASGAPGNWTEAVLAYNHSTAYVEDVLSKARYFQQHVPPPGQGSTPPADAKPAASSGSAADVQALAAATGCVPAAASQVINPADGGPYVKPLTSWTMTGLFWEVRPKEGGGTYNHQGTDLAAPMGTPIYSIGNGTVTFAGPASGYGTYICIQHTQRLTSCYGHESRIEVKVGETVKRGQQIAQVGAEGDATGPHLHFEIKLDGALQCPANYFGVDPSQWCEPGSPGYGARPI